jgi:hypothetical protein
MFWWRNCKLPCNSSPMVLLFCSRDKRACGGYRQADATVIRTSDYFTQTRWQEVREKNKPKLGKTLPAAIEAYSKCDRSACLN